MPRCLMNCIQWRMIEYVNVSNDRGERYEEGREKRRKGEEENKEEEVEQEELEPEQ